MAVGSDLRRGLHRGHALHLGRLLQEGGHTLRVGADVGEDEGALVAGPAGEVALQQVVGPLRVGAGQPAGAGGPGALEGGAADDGENEEGHPPGDDQAPAVVAETGEASEHGSSRGQATRPGDSPASPGTETILRGMSRHHDPRA